MVESLPIGGLTPLTTVDYPGELSAVLFCQGCPWRCRYCHNGHLLPAGSDDQIPWTKVHDFLERRKGLIDAVVFSGGEPTLHSTLPAAMEQVRSMGFKIGLHTAGPYPDRLRCLLPYLDWVGLDIKALPDRYPQITGVPGSGQRAWESLRLLLDTDIALEVRTTLVPGLSREGEVCTLMNELAAAGASNHVLQRCRTGSILDPSLAEALGNSQALSTERHRAAKPRPKGAEGMAAPIPHALQPDLRRHAMKLKSKSIVDGQPIPGDYAFCVPDTENHVALAPNRNPHLAWSGLPADTRSLVLICHDPDVPSRGDDVNQEGREVPADLPRVDFTHWVLVDLRPDRGDIADGEFSSGVTAHGKTGPEGPDRTRQGINSYTDWFAGDGDMAGDYYGYDGPCPPWNDSIVHRYNFTLYALDIPRCPVEGRFGRDEVLAAIDGHVLERASIMGTYGLNPNVPA